MKKGYLFRLDPLLIEALDKKRVESRNRSVERLIREYLGFWDESPDTKEAERVKALEQARQALRERAEAVREAEDLRERLAELQKMKDARPVSTPKRMPSRIEGDLPKIARRHWIDD